jgi:hypothetical protein
MEEVSDKIPRTADGQIIYPMMPVYICQPYSTQKSCKVTVYYVFSDEAYSEKRKHWCVLLEKRYYNGEYWEDGNTEHVSQLYADESECLRVAHAKYMTYLAEQEARIKKHK